jgi:hypothetical protein
MKFLIATRTRRFGWALLTYILAAGVTVLVLREMDVAQFSKITDTQLMTRIFALPSLLAASVFFFITACATSPAQTVAKSAASSTASAPAGAFVAQIVGLQWLNPLERKDYPTEWQLLWTLGLAKPNKDDDMVEMNPKKYSTLQAIGIIAYANRGKETFDGFHEQNIRSLIEIFFKLIFRIPTTFTMPTLSTITRVGASWLGSTSNTRCRRGKSILRRRAITFEIISSKLST